MQLTQDLILRQLYGTLEGWRIVLLTEIKQQQKYNLEYENSLEAQYNSVMTRISSLAHPAARDPLGAFPPEVWSTCVEHSLPEYGRSSALLILTLVSSKWRDFILSTPPLWRNVHVDGYDEDSLAFITASLHLSVHSRLTITVWMPLSPDWDPIWKLLRNHTTRIQEIRLHISPQMAMEFSDPDRQKLSNEYLKGIRHIWNTIGPASPTQFTIYAGPPGSITHRNGSKCKSNTIDTNWDAPLNTLQDIQEILPHMPLLQIRATVKGLISAIGSHRFSDFAWLRILHLDPDATGAAGVVDDTTDIQKDENLAQAPLFNCLSSLSCLYYEDTAVRSPGYRHLPPATLSTLNELTLILEFMETSKLILLLKENVSLKILKLHLMINEWDSIHDNLDEWQNDDDSEDDYGRQSSSTDYSDDEYSTEDIDSKASSQGERVAYGSTLRRRSPVVPGVKELRICFEFTRLSLNPRPPTLHPSPAFMRHAASELPLPNQRELSEASLWDQNIPGLSTRSNVEVATDFIAKVLPSFNAVTELTCTCQTPEGSVRRMLFPAPKVLPPKLQRLVVRGFEPPYAFGKSCVLGTLLEVDVDQGLPNFSTPHLLSLSLGWVTPRHDLLRLHPRNVRFLNLRAKEAWEIKIDAEVFPSLFSLVLDNLHSHSTLRLASLPWLTKVEISATEIYTPHCTLFCASVLFDPSSCPTMRELVFGHTPELDILWLMLLARNFQPRGISRITRVTVPSIREDLRYQFSTLLAGRYVSEQIILWDLSFAAFQNRLFDTKFPGCHACVQHSLRPCDEILLNINSPIKGQFYPCHLYEEARAANTPKEVISWIEVREALIDEWNRRTELLEKCRLKECKKQCMRPPVEMTEFEGVARVAGV